MISFCTNTFYKPGFDIFVLKIYVWKAVSQTLNRHDR